MTANSDFFESFAAYYSDYYQDVDAAEAVRQWTVLLDQAGVGAASSRGAWTKPALLDLGCGPGWHLDPWRNQGFQVSGLDSSPSMLTLARAQVGRDVDIPLYCANVLMIISLKKIDRRFKRIVSHFNFLSLFAPHELNILFQSISALLEPGGLYIFDHSAKPASPDVHCHQQCVTTTMIDEPYPKIVRRWMLGDGVLDETYWFHDIEHMYRILEPHALSIHKVLDWPLLDNTPGVRSLVVLAKDAV